MSALDVVMVVVGLLVSAFYLISCLVNHENPFFYYEEEESKASCGAMCAGREQKGRAVRKHDQDQSVI